MSPDHQPALPANGVTPYSVPTLGATAVGPPVPAQTQGGLIIPAAPALVLPTLWDRPAVSWYGLNHNEHGLVRFGTENQTNKNAKWHIKAVGSVDDLDLVTGASINVATQAKSVRRLSRELCLELAPLARKLTPNARQRERLCHEEYRDFYLLPEEHERERALWELCEYASAGAADLDHSNKEYVLVSSLGEVALRVTRDEARSLALSLARALWSHLLEREVRLTLWWSSGPGGVGIHGHFGPVEDAAWSPFLPRAARALLIESGQAAGIRTLQGAPAAVKEITAALRERFGPEARAERREKKVCLYVPVPLSKSDAFAWLRWARGCLPPVLLDLSPVSASPGARGNMLRTQWGKTKDGCTRKSPIPGFDAPASPLTRDFLLPYLERARLEHEGRASGPEPRCAGTRGQASVEIRMAGHEAPAPRLRAGPLTEAILERIDVPGVMALLGLDPIQRGHRGRCPLHAGSLTQASFKVTDDGLLWCCYSPSCEPRQGQVARGGNPIWLVAYFAGKSYLEARAWLAKELGVSLEPATKEPPSEGEGPTYEPALRAEPGLEPEQRSRAGQWIVDALRTGAKCERLRLAGLEREHASLRAAARNALARCEIAQGRLRRANRQGGMTAAETANATRVQAERQAAELQPRAKEAYRLLDAAKRSSRRVFAYATCRQYRYCRRYACGAVDADKDRRPLSCDHPLCRECVAARDALARSGRRASWPETVTVVRVPCEDASDSLLPSKRDVQRLRNRWACRTRASRLLNVPRSPLAVVVPGALVLFLEGDCAAVARSIAGAIAQVDVQVLDKPASLLALEAALYLPAEQLEATIREGLRRIDDTDAEASAKERVMGEEVQAWIKILRDRRELEGSRRRILTGKNALEISPSSTAGDEFGSEEVPVGALRSLEPRLPCCPVHGPECKITDYVVTDVLGRTPARRLPGLARDPQTHEIETQAHWLSFNSAVVEYQDPTADTQDQPAPVRQEVTNAIVAAHEPAWVSDDASHAPPTPPASLLGAPDWVLETYDERVAIVAERGGVDPVAECIAEQEALRLWRQQSLELFPGALGGGACGEPSWN